MTEIIVTLAGVITIALIVWWFWLSGPHSTRVEGKRPIEILVKDGVYQPAAIEVPSGQALTLSFLREDATPCAEKVIFSDLGISADLPLGKPQTLYVSALASGVHEFSCQMGMYRGRLIAKP